MESMLTADALVLSLALAFSAAGADLRQTCRPTRSEPAPPYYVPGAPVRARVDSGYVLTGTVRASPSCRPIPRARLEFFLTNPRGEYDDAHRASLFASPTGKYRFVSNFPRRYGGRPPHIHVIVSAPGYRRVVTQHYPRQGTRSGRFDIVLPPRP